MYISFASGLIANAKQREPPVEYRLYSKVPLCVLGIFIVGCRALYIALFVLTAVLAAASTEVISFYNAGTEMPQIN